MIDPMVVDWVELGCRGWHIDETGAGLILPHPANGPNFAHIDLETLNIALCGDGAFLRQAYHDLAAAQVPGMVEWIMTTYPRTVSINTVPGSTSTRWVTYL